MVAGSRYIYELFYEKEAISKRLYDWLLKNGYADGNLIAKWKKQGYEKVCGRLRRRPSLTWKAVLLGLHPDQGDEFQHHLHLQSAAGSNEGRPFDTVCELRVQRVFNYRLASNGNVDD